MAVRVTKEDFEVKVLQSEKPVILDFYSDSCVACKKLAPVLGDIEDDYEQKVNVYKLNTNYDGEIAKKFNIMANPTLLLFKSGEAKAKLVGSKTYDEVADWIDANI